MAKKKTAKKKAVEPEPKVLSKADAATEAAAAAVEPEVEAPVLTVDPVVAVVAAHDNLVRAIDEKGLSNQLGQRLLAELADAVAGLL